MGRQVERGFLAIDRSNEEDRMWCTCQACGNTFDRLEGGTGTVVWGFCSAECESNYKPEPTKQCKICGKHFNGSDLCCSDACMVSWNRLKAERAQDRVQKNKHESTGVDWDRSLRDCKMCGDMFLPTHTFHAYCSDKCRMDNLKQRPHSAWAILNRDGFKCFYCGASSFADGREFHLDHLFPRRKGGADTAANIVTACQLCNLSKSTIVPTVLDEMRVEIECRNAENGISNDMIIKGVDNRRRYPATAAEQPLPAQVI